MEDAATTPWNWCDRRCERCPLSSDCKLYAREIETNEHARERGLDPDDPRAMMQIVGENLARALQLAKEAAEREGISIDDLDETLPVEPEQGRAFADAGREYSDAIHALSKNLGATAIVGEAVFVAFLVGAKAARLTFDLPLCDEDPARDYVAFTVLLIDALLRDSRAIFEVAVGRGVDACGDRLVCAHGELRRQLDRHLRWVRKEDASALADLIHSGRAPSPFCVTTRVTPASA